MLIAAGLGKTRSVFLAQRRSRSVKVVCLGIYCTTLHTDPRHLGLQSGRSPERPRTGTINLNTTNDTASCIGHDWMQPTSVKAHLQTD